MEAKIADITRLFLKFKAAYEKNDLDTSEIILSQLKVRRFLDISEVLEWCLGF